MRVLVVGGTGPSGPHVVRGLAERGHEITIFHRGTHESPETIGFEHLHGDPHFRESIDETLGTRTFDVVLAMYGRVQHLAPALRGRCNQFVSVGGVPVYRGYFPRPGSTLPIPVEEDHPLVEPGDDDPALRFSGRLTEAERAVFAHHPGGTVLRYPMLYGPNNARPHEWSVVRRIRDRRPFMILPDGGIQVHTRCAVRNAAAYVLAAVGHPGAAGHAFNCGDRASWSFRDWAELIARLLGADLDILALPRAAALDATASILPLAGSTAEHCVLSTEKARRLLGYRPAVEPEAAMVELLAWYDEQPGFAPGTNPSFTDRFDYATEDALVAHYRSALRRLGAAIQQHPAPPAHSMPHPQRPGLVDDRGR